MNSADVVIVGGAVIGSAAAYFLATQPAFAGSVLVLERDFSYRHCATARSAASIRHQFSTPENIRISQYGSEFIRHAGEWLRVGDDALELDFHEAGYLFLATRAGRGVLESNHRVQRGLGVDVELLEPEHLGQRLPWLACADLGLASLGRSGEGWLDASGLMQGFRRKAQSLGVRYLEAQAVALDCSRRRVQGVRLRDGSRIGCSVVINAAGTGARALADTAGIRLPVQSRKRCVFHFRSPASLTDCPLVIDPSGVWFRPEGSGFICGVSPVGDDDPECEDFEVTHSLWDEVLWPTLAARVPAFEAARVFSAWAGHYDVNTLDRNVILGAHPELDNLLFANGFSGHGLQQAPAIGRALAELVSFGAYRMLDLSALGWRRVIDNQPLCEINVV